ncbi:MAG TPA: peptidoglycan DD-metalloendopeptidase family protein [Gemmatimonadales bacterium]
MRGTWPAWVALVTTLIAAPGYAQDNVDRQIRNNQARLDSIRQERTSLEGELTRLRGRIRNISGELSNLEQQKTATSRIVNELDRQMGQLSSQLDTITLDLLLAQDAVAEQQAIRERRVVEIYKRGRLWGFQVLLAAESFADLLGRYKYLFLVSRQDQALVTAMQHLRDRIDRERRQMATVQRELTGNREERGRELARFQRLERERLRSLEQTRTTAARATERLGSLEATEQQLNTLIADLERRRRAAIAAGRVTEVAASITPASLGTLAWPAEGRLLYRFGPAAGPGNSVIRYQGVGIGVPVGTPVRAVANGEVVFAGPYGTYGLSVMLDHGGGFYTLYLYLSRVNVAGGTLTSAGDQVGVSGGAASDEGPHVEFQIREHRGGGLTIALDPLNWLRPRR